MKSVLLSIKPEHAQKILSHEKRMEFRKKIWSKDTDIIYLYASHPIQRLVGALKAFSILFERKEQLWLFGQDLGGITKKQFDAYFQNHSHGYGIHICSLDSFEKQIDPKAIDPDFKAPQNFMYLRKEFETKLRELIIIGGDSKRD